MHIVGCCALSCCLHIFLVPIMYLNAILYTSRWAEIKRNENVDAAAAAMQSTQSHQTIPPLTKRSAQKNENRNGEKGTAIDNTNKYYTRKKVLFATKMFARFNEMTLSLKLISQIDLTLSRPYC